MSVIHITEFSGSGAEISGVRVPIAMLPAVTVQEITISGASAQSAAFNAETRMIRISADAACRIRVGASPTAVATDLRVGADSPEYFGVLPGQKLAAITG
jgi:hypothetical protein